MSSPAPGAAGLPPVTRWLVLAVAAIGFLFDTYELLMFPVIGAQAWRFPRPSPRPRGADAVQSRALRPPRGEGYQLGLKGVS